MVKLTTELENRIKKVLESKGMKDVDIKALWDNRLSVQENLKNIIGTDKLTPVEANKTEMEIIQKKIIEEDKKLLLELEKESIEKIKKSLTPNVEKYYQILKEFVTMVAEGFSNSLIIIGNTALGKTWNTLKTLDECKINYVYHSGFTSPLALYKFLYEYKDDFIIFFDDTVGILSSNAALSIMLPAIWSTTEIRKVSWHSTSGKLENLPKSFPITSRIIFCMNEIPDNEKIRTVVSRCLRYSLEFSYKVKLQIMYEIAKIKHSMLALEERLQIVDFIAENTDSSTQDLNLRTQKKIEDIYLYSKKHKRNWKELAFELIKEKSDAITVVRQLLESGREIEEQIKEFNRLTGRSKRTYFRIKEKLVKDSG